MIYRVTIVAVGWYGTQTHTYHRDFETFRDANDYRARESASVGWRVRSAVITEIKTWPGWELKQNDA